MQNRQTYKTYSHLLPLKRVPTEYEVVTTGLLYYPKRGFEVETPVAQWYGQHPAVLQNVKWSDFHDPQSLTYSKYVAHQAKQEIFADQLLGQMESADYLAGLSASWRRDLHLLLATLRFPIHGLQMLIAYIGQMAPEGRIVIASLLQAADEMRRVQRFAYRMVLLGKQDPLLADVSRDAWQFDVKWQDLRRLIETMLVIYNWEEAFIALQLCLKPEFDRLFLSDLSRICVNENDHAMSALLLSLHGDSLWQQAWSAKVVQLMEPENSAIIELWKKKWEARAGVALAPWHTSKREAERTL